MNIKDNDSIIEQVSFVNEAFYLAFESKDLSAMESIWADREDIYCLHPGWHPLTGRKNILESWARILSNEAQPQISFDSPKFMPTGPDSVAVICFERAPQQNLIATNIYQRDEERFHLIFHQSGICD